MGGLVVKRGVSSLEDARAAAVEVADQVRNAEAAIVLVFASCRYHCAELARAASEALAPTPVYGCTTAGEIAGTGFVSDSVVAISLTSDRLRVGAGLATGISLSGFSGGRTATLAALDQLGVNPDDVRADRHVAVCLVDGRSGQEEGFIAGACASAPEMRFVGGSASDHLSEQPRARVFFDGEACVDCGTILVFETDLPFATLKSEHMVPTEHERVVVTAIEEGDRLVHELNGLPARSVYAEIVGAGDAAIDTALAARNPFGYYVGGQPYVRSVILVEGDSLRFACAVDRGAVLKPMRPGEMIGKTGQDLRELDDRVGGVSALIAFNCLGRYLEAEATGNVGALGRELTKYPVVGFNTLGEQYNALHVNHTLTALAFGGGDG